MKTHFHRPWLQHSCWLMLTLFATGCAALANSLIAAGTGAPSQAAANPSSCSGIELMGLYKNDMRPMAPLILWFAKVRNATSVTRIVTVGWTNLYAQEKIFRAEIGSGDIATLELTRQQPVERQPTNLRLIECQ